MATATSAAAPSREDFAKMLEESFTQGSPQEGSVCKGIVVGIEKDVAVIDVGAKTEGRVALREFAAPGRASEIKIAHCRSLPERVENALGRRCSPATRPGARKAGALETAFKNNERSRASSSIRSRRLHGRSRRRGGVSAALAGRHPSDSRRPADEPAAAVPDLKMDRRRGNIVVSRRTVLEETRAEQRQELVHPKRARSSTAWSEHHRLRRVVDSRRHRRPAPRHRHRVAAVNHPTGYQHRPAGEGQDHRDQPRDPPHLARPKQLLDDPWQGIGQVPGRRVSRVRVPTSPTTAHSWSGAGHRGPDPRLRMSWTKKNVRGQDRLDVAGGRGAGARVDPVSGISLGLRPCAIPEVLSVSAGHHHRGRGQNKTEFGLFLGLDGGSTVVHLSDLDGSVRASRIEEFKKGDKVQAQVLDVDVEKERIRLASSSSG